MSRENLREFLFEEVITHDFLDWAKDVSLQMWESYWIQARINKFSVEISISKCLVLINTYHFSFHRL